MSKSGFTGISYPFRISNRGGVVMSTTSASDATHIKESIQQILSTRFLERPMEADIYSDVDSAIFEPDDDALQEMIKSDIVDAVNELDERVELDEEDIDFEIEEEDGVEMLYAIVTYKVVRYNTTYTDKVKVGEVENE